MPQTVKKIPKIIVKLEKANPEITVTAEMIRDECAKRIETMNQSGRYTQQTLPAVRTFQTYLHKTGRKAYRNLRKPPITAEHVKARLKFSQTHVRKSIMKWKQNCMTLDEKQFRYYGTPSGKMYTRMKGKRSEPVFF